MKFKKFWLLVVVVLEVDKGPQDHKLGKGGGGGGGGLGKGFNRWNVYFSQKNWGCYKVLKN